MAVRALTLTRPLVVFDLETTGLDVHRDRIIEISCVKIGVDDAREIRTRRLNPGMPISPQATAVHGIRDEDVKDEPRFMQVAKKLLEFLDGCDLSGFNIEHFDLPLLVREFQEAGVKFPRTPVHVIDAWRIFLTKEPRDLSAAYRFYCGKTLENAHSAEADAVATADILAAQVSRYEDLPLALQELHEYCHPVHPDWLDPDGKLVWRGSEAALGFGKNRDRTLRDLLEHNRDYLEWMAGADFSEEVRRIVRNALKGQFPESPEPAANGNGAPVVVPMRKTGSR